MATLLLDVRHRAEYLLLRLIAALVRLMPLDVGVNVSARLWRVLAPYGRRQRRALENLAIAFPEKTPSRRPCACASRSEVDGSGGRSPT
jgi:KDO2-lipid IV(A) lauroyltransferase